MSFSLCRPIKSPRDGIVNDLSDRGPAVPTSLGIEAAGSGCCGLLSAGVAAWSAVSDLGWSAASRAAIPAVSLGLFLRRRAAK